MKPERQSKNIFKRLLGAVDMGSLKIRLWGYFGLFAVILVAMLWILQVVFLNYYYEDMKLRETQRIVADIESRFQKNESIADIRSYATSTYRQSGIYLQIEPEHGSPIVIPFVNFDYTAGATDASGNEIEELPAARPGSFYPTVYRNEIDNLKTQLIESGSDSFSKQTVEPETERKTLEYAVFLKTPPIPGEVAVPDLLPAAVTDSAEGGGAGTEAVPEAASDESAEAAAQDSGRLILCMFSPLYPQESTSAILTDQLLYVTIIAVLLSILLGFYLSRMITRPIEEITERAEELAAGNYGIDFPVTHYSEIMRLADTLSAASGELAETRTMQRDIIANVSHDLKTPLTMIRSYAEMIADISGNDPKKRAQHLQVIMDETDRLSAMIAELLDISKLQSGEFSIKRTDFSLKELIKSTITAYQAFVEQDGYKLIFVSKGEGVVRADETRIKQTLDNLISNALKYGGKDKIVEIRMVEKDEYVRVEVTDHGMGIPKRDIKHIWDRYYQTSAHHSRSDSTGLGLSIVKEILVLHDAKYGVESTVRRGSTFWFEILTVGPREGQGAAETDSGG